MDHKVRQTSVTLVNKLLANTSVLLMQTLHYHWNLKGSQFNDIHKMLDGQYEDLFDDLDVLAERVRALQGEAIGTMSGMLQHATLKEAAGVPTIEEMLAQLLQQYEYQIEELRAGNLSLEGTHDFGTKKMLEDLIEKYEKIAWMLRSSLGR